MARRAQSAPTTPRMYILSPPRTSTLTRNRVTTTDPSKTTADLVGLGHLPSPRSDVFNESTKRKWPQDLHDLPPCEPVSKKACLLSSTIQTPYYEFENSNSEFGADICWGDYFGQWPPMEAPRGRSSLLGKKRPFPQLRSNSYSQSVRDGESPQAWTPQHEEKMEKAGLVMKAYQTQAAITSACQRLCDDLKKRDYSPPRGPSFGRDRLLKMLDLVRFRNEARVFRDITPLVIPSPELLSIDGYPGMDQMSEAINAEWTQCNTISGPRPKPDFAIGISSTAFTADEMEKLMLSHTSACPNLFPENMYYPFLICEVKGSGRAIQEAERQSMHSASIAVRAVVQLYQNISAANEVDRKILAFSVAHDNAQVKIFGHFATVEEQKLTFFRCRVYTADFDTDFAKPYNIIRAIYDVFFPQHLARIKSALDRMRGRALESSTSQLDLDEDSQEIAASQPSSQEQGKFKRPSLPSTDRIQEENDRLRDQISVLLREQQQEREDFMKELRERREQMERQLARREEESRERREQMERQLAQQKEESLAQQTEIITLLKERIAK